MYLYQDSRKASGPDNWILKQEQEVPWRLHSNVQLACRILPGFSNRQLSPTMADLSRTCARFYTMAP